MVVGDFCHINRSFGKAALRFSLLVREHGLKAVVLYNPACSLYNNTTFCSSFPRGRDVFEESLERGCHWSVVVILPVTRLDPLPRLPTTAHSAYRGDNDFR